LGTLQKEEFGFLGILISEHAMLYQFLSSKSLSVLKIKKDWKVTSQWCMALTLMMRDCFCGKTTKFEYKQLPMVAYW